MTYDARALLDPPAVDGALLRRIERQLAGILATEHDIVLVQAEAILTLEAVAVNVASPGTTALNIASGPYSGVFGGWMAAAGAQVVDVTTALDSVATVEQVRAALDAHPETSVLALAHAEAATGGSNPVSEICALAGEREVLVVVDAVASIGAESVTPQAWGADLCVIGPQKGLAGPAGVSAVSVSPRAWERVEANPRAPRGSSLSLLDWRDRWLRSDRTVVPGTPSVLETRALAAALDRVEAEGVDEVVGRHAAAAAATREHLVSAGLELWQRGPAGYASVATAVSVPADVDPREFVARVIADGGGVVGTGAGALVDRLVRVNHYGRQATVEQATASAEVLVGVWHELRRR